MAISKTDLQEMLQFHDLWNLNKGNQYGLQRLYKRVESLTLTELEEAFRLAAEFKKGMRVSLADIQYYGARIADRKVKKNKQVEEQCSYCHYSGVIFVKKKERPNKGAEFAFKCGFCSNAKNRPNSYPLWDKKFEETYDYL